jgi:DNA-binding transcriptional MerR regulator
MIEEQTYTIDEIEEQSGFDRRTIAYYVQQGLLPKVGRRGPRTRYSQLFLNRLRFIRVIRGLQDQGAMGSMTLADFRDLFEHVPEETIANVVEGREPPPVVGHQPPADVPSMASPSNRRRTMATRIANLQRAISNGPVAPPLESRGMPMDPAQESPPEAEPDASFGERAYVALPDVPQSTEDRDTPSGEYHRLTLEALERRPGAPVLERKSSPPRPADEELREALARLSAVVRRQPRAYLRTTETWTRARVTEELSLSARGLTEKNLPLLERVAQILRRLMREGEGGV